MLKPIYYNLVGNCENRSKECGEKEERTMDVEGIKMRSCVGLVWTSAMKPQGAEASSLWDITINRHPGLIASPTHVHIGRNL